MHDDDRMSTCDECAARTWALYHLPGGRWVCRRCREARDGDDGQALGWDALDELARLAGDRE